MIETSFNSKMEEISKDSLQLVLHRQHYSTQSEEMDTKRQLWHTSKRSYQQRRHIKTSKALSSTHGYSCIKRMKEISMDSLQLENNEISNYSTVAITLHK